MTSPTLERAARAVFDAVNVDSENAQLLTETWEATRPEYLTYARAVLMAVREPDALIRQVGVGAWEDEEGYNDGMIPSIAFTAMIDAILAEGE